MERWKPEVVCSAREERLLKLAGKTKGFDWKKTPKSLRLGVDSRPLEGAGRVDDTINLLGHAASRVSTAPRSRRTPLIHVHEVVGAVGEVVHRGRELIK